MYSFLLLLLSLAAIASCHAETHQKKVIITEIFFNVICKHELIFVLDNNVCMSHIVPIVSWRFGKIMVN